MDRNVKFSYSGIDKNKILKSVNSCLPKNKVVLDYGLIFVSKKKMAELNKKYRKKNKPTNVLSFVAHGPASTRLGEAGEPSPRSSSGGAGRFERETGDVVICSAVVLEEAKKYGFTQKKWMTRLIVHGILHLAGYDHILKKDESLMTDLEQKVLKKLGVFLIS